MFKLFNKKLNKKGFTLAELLVVVAIIAILIAIAIPIFTKSMREAQLRTNQANMRSVKAAGITQILSDWGTYHLDPKSNKPAQKWLIAANVDAKGNVSHVAVVPSSNAFTENNKDGIMTDTKVFNKKDPDYGVVKDKLATELALTDDVKNICNVSADTKENYHVYVWATDVDFKTP